MATLLSANGNGIYITQEEDGQIAANTPGGIDIALLSVGDTYIYLERILQFVHTLDFGGQSDNMPGHKLGKEGAGITGHTTGEGDLCGFIIQSTVSETVAENLEKFGKLNNRTGDGTKYLVRQTASNVFRQFPNAAGTMKNYAPVIVMNIKVTEISEKGKDILLATILCAEVQSA